MALKGPVDRGQALNGCSHLENFIMGPGWRSPVSHPGQTAPGNMARLNPRANCLGVKQNRDILSTNDRVVRGRKMRPPSEHELIVPCHSG